MRTGPASRDANFRGIDTDALGQLIDQLQSASSAITSWLGAHRAVAGVSSPGYRQAGAVELWASDQIGMLSRRRNYALTHRDDPDLVTVAPPPPVQLTAKQSPRPAPSPRPRPQPVVEAGAGPDLGAYPDSKSAAKAAATDALAVKTAVKGETPVPGNVWKNLAANAKDPDYTAALYKKLGPEGTARLIAAAEGDEARLKALGASLSTANGQLPLDAEWLAAVLAEADRLGVRADAVHVVEATPLKPRLDDALAQLPQQLLIDRPPPKAPAGTA